MTRDSYDLINRLLILLSFVCIAFLAQYFSIVLACASVIIALIFLVPAVPVSRPAGMPARFWIFGLISAVVMTFLTLVTPVRYNLTLCICAGIASIYAFTSLSCIIARKTAEKSWPSDKELMTGLQKKEIFALLIGSIAVITVMSSSSPLYPYNYWDDANIFLTMGRSIKHGLIPYRDVYEQKGPSIFFIHALAACISEKTFTGVWIIEIAENFFFCFFAWKIVKLYLDPPFIMIVTVPALLSFLCTLPGFYFGDSAEEMCMPLLAAILYMWLKTTRKDSVFSLRYALITGILTGFIFWLKYTMCGMVFGLAIFILIDCLRTKKIRHQFKIIGMFLAGFILFSIPVLIYFTVNNALTDLFTAYFYNNIFLYTSMSTRASAGPLSIPVFGPALQMFLNYSWDMSKAVPSVVIQFLLISAFLLRPRKQMLLLFICFFFTCLGIYMGKTTMFYYNHILMLFSPLALIPVITGLSALHAYIKKRSRLSSVFLSFIMIIPVMINIFISPCVYYLTSVSRDDLPQYRFKYIMDPSGDLKLLTYDVMDIGLFALTDSLPANRYFTYLNINDFLPELREEQDRLISEGYYDYVVAKSPDYDWENYEVIDYEHFQYLGYYREYFADDFYLYGRIEK